MRLFFAFFILLIGSLNAGNNALSVTEWTKANITNSLCSYFKITNVKDGWIGFGEIKKDKLPIVVHLKNDKQCICEYDVTNNILSRFDVLSDTFCEIFDKRKTY